MRTPEEEVVSDIHENQNTSPKKRKKLQKQRKDLEENPVRTPEEDIFWSLEDQNTSPKKREELKKDSDESPLRTPDDEDLFESPKAQMIPLKVRLKFNKKNTVSDQDPPKQPTEDQLVISGNLDISGQDNENSENDLQPQLSPSGLPIIESSYSIAPSCSGGHHGMENGTQEKGASRWVQA